MINKCYRKQKTKGFTIVELLVVIVVIGILAAVTIVSYTGISQRASVATLQSDLKNASIQLGIDNVNNGGYPATEANANNGRGLPKSTGTVYQYSLTSSGYCISATSTAAGSTYRIDSVKGIIETGGCALTFKQVAVGEAHTCAIASDDRPYCWGYNFDGELGNNSTVSSRIPVAVNMSGALSGKTVKAITAGEYHTCVIASDDKAYCWGINGSGQLGNNSTTSSSVPVAVNTSGVLSGKTIKAISATSNQHTCAIASDNLAYCWGNGGSGQIGDGTTNSSLVPVAVDVSGVLVGKTFKAISAGWWHTCAIASDDKAYCWGYNSGSGQLGDNTMTNRTSPVAVDATGVLSGKTVKAIASSYTYSCAIASDNLPYCWGNSNYGELGNNPSVNMVVPAAVDMSGVLSGKTVKSITATYHHTCAIASDDNAYCWGHNSAFSGGGQIGNNSTTDALSPAAVSTSGVLSGKTIKAISAGYYHTCAVASDNLAYCWGYQDSYGQLGNNTTTSSLVPVATSALPQ